MIFRRSLFYESHRSRTTAEILSFFTDTTTFLIATFMATAILHRPTGRIEETIFLALWAAIPRALSRGLAWMERPQDPLKSYGFSAFFIVCVSILLYVGWDLVYTENHQLVPMGGGTAIVILLTWCSMLLLFQPSAYRLFDFLCGATLLLGLLESKPYAWVWVPCFAFSWLLSSVTRHWIHDVAKENRLHRFNLQNARILAVLGTLMASGLFFLAYFMISGGEKFPDVQDLHARAFQPGGFIAKTEYITEPEYRTQHQGRGENQKPSQRANPISQRLPQGPNYQLPIKTVGSGLGSQKTAWRVRPADSESKGKWPPPSGSLWRSVTCSTFDPINATWSDDSKSKIVSFKENQIVQVRKPPQLPEGQTRYPDELYLEYIADIPIFQGYLCLETPFALKIHERGNYLQNEAMDILPLRHLLPGTEYQSRSLLRLANKFPNAPVHNRKLANLNPKYYEVPPAHDLGLDLNVLAKKIFPRGLGAASASIQQKLNSLKEYFVSKGFLYNRLHPWRQYPSHFREFIRLNRVGTCTHYATTSALLLRTQGIATRVVFGFLGGEHNAETDEVHLKISMAHLWLEVYFPEYGWITLDPTNWIRRALDDPTANQSNSNLPDVDNEDTEDDLQNPDPTKPEELADNHQENQRPKPEIPLAEDALDPNRNTLPENTTIEKEEEDDFDISAWFKLNAGRSAENQRQRRERRGGSNSELQNSRGNSPQERTYEHPRSYRESIAHHTIINNPGRTKTRRILRATMIGIAGLLALLFISIHRYYKRKKAQQDLLPLDEDEFEDEIPEDFFETIEVIDDGSPRSQIISKYHQLQNSLAKTRLQRSAHQTPHEHAKSLAQRIKEVAAPIERVATIFSKALYHHKTPEADEVQEHGNECEKVKRKTN